MAVSGRMAASRRRNRKVTARQFVGGRLLGLGRGLGRGLAWPGAGGIVDGVLCHGLLRVRVRLLGSRSRNAVKTVTCRVSLSQALPAATHTKGAAELEFA